MKKILLIGLILLAGLHLKAQKITNGSGQLVTDGSGALLGHPAVAVNMLANGTFDDSSDWGLISNWSIADGVATYDDLGIGSLAQEPSNMVSNVQVDTDYKLTFDISITSGTAYIKLESYDASVTYVSYAAYGNGSHEVTFTSPSDISTGGIRIKVANAATDNPFDLDNVVLVEN